MQFQGKYYEKKTQKVGAEELRYKIGIDSYLLEGFTRQLAETLGWAVDASFVFEYGTIRAIAEYACPNGQAHAASAAGRSASAAGRSRRRAATT